MLNKKSTVIKLTILLSIINGSFAVTANDTQDSKSIEQIIALSQDDQRIWTGTQPPNNAWWVPIEYERNHTSAAEAVIKLTGGVPGYTIDIGAKRKEMSRPEFRTAAAVGKLVHDAGGGRQGTCTATHVGNNYVVTAGHCFPDPTTSDVCKNLTVEWNHRISYKDYPNAPLEPKKFIGRCTRVASWQFTGGDYKTIDHAIFRVDVAPEVYAPIDPKPALAEGDAVHQFAHPGGNKLIWIDNCKITGKPLQYFKHNCWTANGSSGGALIDAKTYNVVGVLSMGSDDTFFSVRNDISPIGCFNIYTGQVNKPCPGMPNS